ncbi:NAD(P)-binding protein [Saccharata proteae CBS 121410]|uniref:NAD(P)-binding protein n=1 Tax=Saccharata proteae CBS 121410 TaxID=1314787 RepID=A0A9P4LTP8_9PEZI|nr:NAD(P)-binding protein [Saccharata proteae CBS 121410]
MSSTSLSLGPPTETPGSLFLRSQFLSPVQWPPSTTSLCGKSAIITGSSSGLGLEASRQMLSLGLSTLVMAVRSVEKGEGIASTFRTEYPDAKIMVWSLEMESYVSIQAFVKKVETELLSLDIAILNAATQTADFTTTKTTGHEMLLQVNYLSTALLGILLLPTLKKKCSTAPGRLTIVNSGTSRGASISEPPGKPLLASFDDKTKPWDPVERYAVSKLLGHLFIVELVRHVRAEDVVVNLVDPGLVKGTDLQRGAPMLLGAFFTCMKAVMGRPVPVGASTYVDAAVLKGKESHGSLVADWKVSPFAAFVYTPEGEAVRKQLWEETLKEFEFGDVKGILEGLKK